MQILSFVQLNSMAQFSSINYKLQSHINASFAQILNSIISLSNLPNF